MNQKITAKAISKLEGKSKNDLVALNPRTTAPLSEAQIDQLMQWGGKLLYDSGIVAVVEIQAGHVDDLAERDNVIEIN